MMPPDSKIKNTSEYGCSLSTSRYPAAKINLIAEMSNNTSISIIDSIPAKILNIEIDVEMQ
ncbi:MAG: hypothetical protein IT232_05535 [Flavobacteriales bacterium]|nr:hypothetical protein [Flavobacteriales bacterium]